CEALGDRLEEAFQDGDKSRNLRRDASFCFLAGSKLEKVVNNWVQELHEQETAALQASESDNDFSVHAKCLQGFVEKVSVFRQVTKFQDTELNAAEEWKLAPLYALYSEYADILAAHGQLNTAQQYISLLPTKFGGAEAAQSRLSQATKKSAAPVAAQRQPATAASRRQPSMAQSAQASFQPAAPLVNQARNAPSPYAPAGTTVSPAASQSPYAPPANPYTPAGYQPPQAAPMYGGYQPPQPASTIPPPPRAGTSSPSV
ncbi:hypothetical protein KC334_g22085, partial [Hortaea werneckii]